MVALSDSTIAVTWKDRPILSLLDASGQLDTDGEVASFPHVETPSTMMVTGTSTVRMLVAGEVMTPARIRQT